MDNKHWGRTSSEQLVDALAAVLPPEKMEELNTLAANLKAPDEPGYTGPLEEEAKKLANAKEEFIQGWALEVAARKLGLSPRSIFDENPAIHEKAREIRNDPEFKEVIGEMVNGKTNEELREIKTAHVTGDLGRYSVAKERIHYEKQCAEVIVNRTMSEYLDKLDPEERREQLDAEIARCRQMPAFQKVMDARFENIINVSDVNWLLRDIKKPQHQETLWEDMIDAQNQVLQAETNRPVQMGPQQPQVPQQDQNQVGEGLAANL